MTQFNTPQFSLQRATGRCAATERELIPGETYIACLVEMTDEEIEQARKEKVAELGLKRLDFSLEGWEQSDRPEGLFCYWKTTVRQPNEKPKVFVDDEVLMQLFERLEEAEEIDKLQFRFVLGLVLMRKKLLQFEGQEEATDREDGNYWLLKKRKSDQVFHVFNPQLDDEGIASVTAQISEILDGDLS